MRTRLLPGLLFLMFVLAGCGTTYLARPVGRGNTAVNVSLGGPLVRLGAPIPVPLTSVSVAHGLYEALDVHAGLHPLVALFNPGNGSIPVLGMDMGFVVRPIPNHRNALSLGGTMYGFSNQLDAVVFSDVWISGDIRATNWLSLALGFHNVFRIATSDRELSQRSLWSPTLFAQVALRPTQRFEIQVEGRWYAFTENGNRVAPGFVPIGELGALGVQLGFTYRFGGAW